MTANTGCPQDTSEGSQGRLPASLLVGSGIVSVITEADLNRAIAAGAPPDDPVSKFAHVRADLRLVNPNTSLIEAARLMQGREVATVHPGVTEHRDTEHRDTGHRDTEYRDIEQQEGGLLAGLSVRRPS
jgi:hypothetical protein